MSGKKEKKRPAPAIWIAGLPYSGHENIMNEVAEILGDEVTVAPLPADDLRENLLISELPEDEILRPVTYLVKQLQKNEIIPLVSWPLWDEEQIAYLRDHLVNSHVIFIQSDLEDCLETVEESEDDWLFGKLDGLGVDDLPTESNPIDLMLEASEGEDYLVNSVLDYIDKHNLKEFRSGVSTEEEEEVTDRLKNLGYI